MTTQKKEYRVYNFDFIGKFWIAAVVSIATFILALVVIGVKGFNYGIDFSGGTEMQVKFATPIDPNTLRKFVEDQGLHGAQVQKFGEGNEYLIRFESQKGKSDKETNEFLKANIEKVNQGLKTSFGDAGPDVRRVDSVGPQVGSQLKRNSIMAGLYSLLLILIYVSLRFDYKYAPGAVICLFHDAIVALGILSLLNYEINIQVLAAILTLIGHSMNDTIVTFDRVRENEAKMRGAKLKDIINRSINEVLGRSIVTVFTTFLAVIALYFFAGGVIENFAFTMLIGLVLGVYSSIYVAAPLVVVFERFKAKSA
ncbi:MAG: protein translocase subunit SecF [Bdellovibrionales bacterium]